MSGKRECELYHCELEEDEVHEGIEHDALCLDCYEDEEDLR